MSLGRAEAARQRKAAENLHCAHCAAPTTFNESYLCTAPLGVKIIRPLRTCSATCMVSFLAKYASAEVRTNTKHTPPHTDGPVDANTRAYCDNCYEMGLIQVHLGDQHYCTQRCADLAAERMAHAMAENIAGQVTLANLPMPVEAFCDWCHVRQSISGMHLEHGKAFCSTEHADRYIGRDAS